MLDHRCRGDRCSAQQRADTDGAAASEEEESACWRAISRRSHSCSLHDRVDRLIECVCRAGLRAAGSPARPPVAHGGPLGPRRVGHPAFSDAVELRAVIGLVIITALLRLASRPIGTASRFILPTAMLGGGWREQVRSGQVEQGFGVAGGDLGAVRGSIHGHPPLPAEPHARAFRGNQRPPDTYSSTTPPGRAGPQTENEPGALPVSGI